MMINENMMNTDQFEEFLGILKSVKSEDLFNPYTDICPYHDIGMESPNIRSDNLRQYFSIMGNSNYLLIGEAAGYLGCRRTGLPFTDEITLNKLNRYYKVKMKRATKSGKNREHSASQVWKVFMKLEEPPNLWNIVPFHPHKESNYLTNRAPTKKDHEVSKRAVKYFLENTKFTKIFAVGKISEKILANWGFEVDYIRHPSYGGSNSFQMKVMDNFPLKPKENRLEGFLE